MHRVRENFELGMVFEKTIIELERILSQGWCIKENSRVREDLDLGRVFKRNP